METLKMWMRKGASKIPQLLSVYFSRFHPLWPILHAPTFSEQTAEPILVAAMVMMASWIEDSSYHESLAPLVVDILIEKWLPKVIGLENPRRELLIWI
jgi:hypothetical protein